MNVALAKKYPKHRTTSGLPKQETTRATLRDLKAAIATTRDPYADWSVAMTEEINRGAKASATMEGG